jgi:cyclohexanecarboxylate-CoA ligase/acyl-CoA synthetase
MPGVAQCAIAPVCDPRLGERACCYVVPRPGAQITLKAIGSFLLAQGIAKYKLPEQLELRTELPMTATRKVIKGRLNPQSPTV